MSSSQTQELTEVKHLTRLNRERGRGWECGKKERKIQAKEGWSKGMGGRRGREEKNLLRHAWGKLCLWQGRVMPLHSTNATADNWGERKEAKEVDEKTGKQLCRGDVHKPREEEICTLCSLSLSGFSYFSARHYSPGTLCAHRACVCLCVCHVLSILIFMWVAALKACACFIRFKAKWWNSPHWKQETHTHNTSLVTRTIAHKIPSLYSSVQIRESVCLCFANIAMGTNVTETRMKRNGKNARPTSPEVLNALIRNVEWRWKDSKRSDEGGLLRRN